MKIELVAADGHCYQIHSDDPEIIGKWFAEHIPIAVMRNSMPPARLWVYPTGDYDYREWGIPTLLTAERMQWMSAKFIEWAKEDHTPKELSS